MRIVRALGSYHAGDEIGVNLMLAAGRSDDGLQINILRGSARLLRIGRSRLEAFDLGGGNIDVAARRIVTHIQASGVADDLVVLVPEAESIAQVRQLGSVQLCRQQGNHSRMQKSTHSL